MKSRIRANPLLVGAVIAISLVVLWLCAVQVSRLILFGNLPYFAQKIERGEAIGRDIGEQLISNADAVREARICQSGFVNGGLSVILINLDHQDQDQDYAGWAAALERADKFTRFALACFPTDGNLWLRTAMVQQAIGERSDEIAKLVTYSQLYAPAEEAVIFGRYRLYNRLTESTLALLSDIIAADFKIICSDIGSPLRRRLPTPSPLFARWLSLVVPDCKLPQDKKTGKTRRELSWAAGP